MDRDRFADRQLSWLDASSPGPGRWRNGLIHTVSVSTLEVVNFAMVIGAISAAMISAIWLIRERGKIDAENTELRDGPRGCQREDVAPSSR
jgi:hypothetical protein